jgi:ABC-type transporter MlaC component
MNLRHSLGRIVAGMLVLGVFSSIHRATAAENFDATSPEQVIRHFYQWYVNALVNHRDPFEKDRATLKRFTTERLLRTIDHMRKGPDGLDGDYFLDAQDFDAEWGKNITVASPIIKDKKAAVAVELSGKEMGPRKLMITLVLERGAWKIDNVSGEG